MKNFIGIETAKAEQLTSKLNELLSDYQIFYQNLRGFHWNIKGDDFFELHVKFEEFYTNAALKIDEIAERILTLGGTPLHSFKAYLDTSEIKPLTHVAKGKMGAEFTLEGFINLIRKEREILALASEAQDEGTVTLMSDYITETEKTIWMLRSYLGGDKK